MENNSQIKKFEPNNSLANLPDAKAIESITVWAKAIVDSKFTPLKTPQDVVTAVLFGNELGLSPMQSVQGIYPVEGKATVSVHLMKGLLIARAGVVTEIVDDYTPLYGYTDARRTITFAEADVLDNPNIIITSYAKPVVFDPATGKTPDGKLVVAKEPNPYDWKTTIKMTRRMPNGDVLVVQRTRYFSDYKHLHTKANWKNSPKDMLFARVNGVVGREIAGDVLGGLYTPEELSEVVPNVSEHIEIETKISEVIKPQENFKATVIEDIKEQPSDIQEAVIIEQEANNQQ